MNYPSIRIEGRILSPDILDRIEDADGQKPAHFSLDSSIRVKEEILRVWADAQDYWRIFQRKLESLKADFPATTETRNLWIVPFLSLLGYQLEYQARGTELNGKTYPISHRVTNRKLTPLHIIGYLEPSGLDRKPEKMALRMSAHAMVQEYLNLSDQLYGIVTNGRLLRVLRDSSRLVKLSYLEFDLDRIFADSLFAEFAILFRLLHATRLPKDGETAASCWLERYHQKSIDEGTRIRDGLRDAVTEALEVFGTGFLAHPENTTLRQQISSGEVRPESYFNYLLRLVYRLLFLLVVEDRGLVFPKGVSRKNVALYFQHYSIQRLRRLAVTRGLKVERFHDACLSLLSTFQLFEDPTQAAKVGTTVFGGELFNPESLGPLIKCRLSNAGLFSGLERLCYFEHPETKQRMPVNFGALATEEFGSVYESLLELHPVVETEPTPHFGFRQVAGNERKTTGSYYTPTSLVTCLLDSALDPVLEDRIQNFKSQGFKSVDEAVLALNVCDPACGSGHFLIAAAQRIARRLAILRAGDEEPSPDLLRRTLREVIGNCIHGVDVNPMSVELCKVALWLEAVEPGKPLNFLDHHLKCGNSLLGATPESVRDGVPDKAYEPITGDDKEVAKWMRKLNKDAREGQAHFDFAGAAPWDRLGNLPAAMAELEMLQDETPEALKRKEKLYYQIVGGSGYENAHLLYDTWCGAFVWPKQERHYGSELTTEHLRKIERNPHSVSPNLKATVYELKKEYGFFHWLLEFPAVFGVDGEGGFDVIVGNPPWDKIQPEEEKFFSFVRPDIVNAKTAVLRKELIANLPADDPATHLQWTDHKRHIEGICQFVKSSGRFRYSEGNLNTYRVFAELATQILSSQGRAGLVVQSGIATDETGKELFDHLLAGKRLVQFLDFENRERFFPAVDSRFRFCLLTVGGAKAVESAGTALFGWLLHSLDELRIPGRLIKLSAADLRLFNPTSKTCPVFISERDFAVSRKIYNDAKHIFINETNRFSRIEFLGELFNLTRDSKYFVAADVEMSEEFLPLYEAKYIHQFDHRFATSMNGSVDDALQSQKQRADFYANTAKVVTAGEVRSRLRKRGISSEWLLGFRDISSGTNERTAILAAFPVGAVGNSINLVLGLRNLEASYLLANVNTFSFDYCCRQKVGGTHVNIWIFKQLPIVPPEKYIDPCPWSQTSFTYREWIVPRVLELTYTAWDLEPFGQDCGFDGSPFRWEEERRFQIRCELDAAFFHLYLGSEEEWRRQPESLTKYFSTPREAVAYIMDTFPIVKRKDEEKYATYRTKDTILEIYDDLAESQRTGQPYVSPLNPPPGPPTDEHGHFIPISQWDRNNWPSHIHPPRDAPVATPEEVSVADFAAMAYPASDTDKAICAAALAIVEQSGGLSSLDHLDALLLVTHPDWCKVFLDQMDRHGFDVDARSAPGSLFVGQDQSIRWKDCRDYLEQRKALAVGRTGKDQRINAGTALASVKTSLPSGVDRIVQYAFKAVEQIRSLRQNLSFTLQDQQTVLSALEEHRKHQLAA